jgi:ABC-type transport system substrate-binding protein
MLTMPKKRIKTIIYLYFVAILSLLADNTFYTESLRITGFDPVDAVDVATSKAVSRIYEGLLQFSYLDRPYKLIPNLASQMPIITEDGLVYTFKIRDNIYFQDDRCFPDSKGRRVTASDFVFSIKRLADFKNGSSGWMFIKGKIHGLDEFYDKSTSETPTDYQRDVIGLKVLDDYTLQISITEPYPQFLWFLAMSYVGVVPQEAVVFYKDKFNEHPVGTGPYVLKEWRRNFMSEFVRNPKWKETGRVESFTVIPTYQKDCIEQTTGSLPYIDRIVSYVIDDISTKWLMFLNGNISILGDVPRDYWDAVMTKDGQLQPIIKEKKIELVAMPSLDVFYIGFNMDDPILKNVNLRRAICCAFNFDAWNKFHNNKLALAKSPIPPGVAGSLEVIPPYAFNLEKAKQLMIEAGYPDGIDPVTKQRLRLSLDLGRTDQNHRESTDLFVSFMEKIGVVVETKYNNWPSFLTKVANRESQMFRIGWIADYPDAQNFLQLFISQNVSPGPNRANFCDDKFDAMYNEIITMQDTLKRTKLYEEMAEYIMQQVPWINLYHRKNFTLYHSKLKNYVPSDFPYGMEKYYYIKQD